jgi:chromosome transmission fidelity protein 18
MSSDYPEIPTSFDPAIHLHSEADLLRTPASPSYSDDLDALRQCIESEKARKTREGIVIQNRAWTTEEAFRSEEDHPISTL